MALPHEEAPILDLARLISASTTVTIQFSFTALANKYSIKTVADLPAPNNKIFFMKI